MAVKQKPVPGYYYINLTGQLIRVKALLYVEGEMARVFIEYMDGRTVKVSAEEWSWLDLSMYTEWLGRRKQDMELENEL